MASHGSLTRVRLSESVAQGGRSGSAERHLSIGASREVTVIPRLTAEGGVAPRLLFSPTVQIRERRWQPDGGWADETLPGTDPRRGEDHPFDGLLRKIHRLLNPPRPEPAAAGVDQGESSQIGEDTIPWR